MCDKPITLKDLIIAAICYLQEKNWVGLCEIAECVAAKRGCKVEQIQGMIKIILCKARNAEIVCEKKGMYRIMERYDDLPNTNLQNKNNNNNNTCNNITISDDDSDEEDECKGPNPCECLKLSKDCLDDDDEEEERCPTKKRKCR